MRSAFFTSMTATAIESNEQSIQTMKKTFGIVPNIVVLLSVPNESDENADKNVSCIRKSKKPPRYAHVL